MVKCKNCIHLHNCYDDEGVITGRWCDWLRNDPDIESLRHCLYYRAKSNADLIRNMTDVELAEWLFNHDKITQQNGRLTIRGLMTWLQSKVEG